jgi:hypothetical protein
VAHASDRRGQIATPPSSALAVAVAVAVALDLDLNLDLRSGASTN